VKVAEAYGAVGLRARKNEEVEGVILEALKVKKPVLIDFVIEPEENVYPMVPAGGAIHEMIFDEDNQGKKPEKKKLVKIRY